MRSGAFLVGAAAAFGPRSFAQGQSTPPETPDSETSGAIAPSSDATTVFVNGTILTVDAEFSVAEAIRIVSCTKY